jgi:hypothetical protein
VCGFSGLKSQRAWESRCLALGLGVTVRYQHALLPPHDVSFSFMLTKSSALGAHVRKLGPEDAGAYAEFRLKMWPTHPGAGSWESIRLKYFRNPLAFSCPQSGLYAYFEGADITGMMGAYPMPVTLNGALHAGHMIVDWAVLPERQFGPVTGTLWNVLVTLPGRKFSSIGTSASQKILEKRAVQVPSTNITSYLRPIPAKIARYMRLEAYAHPSPVFLEDIALPNGVATGLAETFTAPQPQDPREVAFVKRDVEFWRVYCSGRIFNGAVPLSIKTRIGQANVIVRLLECGRFRYANLMAVDLNPATADNAYVAGALLRQSLRALGVVTVNAVDVDDLTHVLMKALGRLGRPSSSYWWVIPRPSDAFQHQNVRWWLTNADRDSHWSGNQPFAGNRRAHSRAV